MYTRYFKQALQLLKENPLVSTISVLGTALSIAVILILTLMFQINNAGYAPESNRNRMLYVLGIDARGKNNHTRGWMSSEVVKECFYTLHEPEAVTAITSRERPVSRPGMRSFKPYNVKYTDAGFWEVFDFTFLHGAPFTGEEFKSGISRAVISEQLARELFNTGDAVGQTVLLEQIPFTVCGVVKTVSRAAGMAFADVWVPYSCKPELVSASGIAEGMYGSFQIIMLARDRDSFRIIREELEQQTKRYSESKDEFKISFGDSPFSRMDMATGSDFLTRKPLREYVFNTGGLLLFLLLVPALNLTGVIQSSVQKRQAEIGIRKAFGATQGNTMRQLLLENLVSTGIGGVLGLALSFVFLWLGKPFLLTDATLITADMLFKPMLFIAVFLFVLLLNCLSAGIPARQISRKQIVAALKDTTN
ncbi:MAG: ABC transporter permease [Tannerella sp.]|nr:ABC transporter permease [Tannerella sp.]